MKMFHFKDENGSCEEVDIPAEFQGKAEDLRAELMEKAAEGDDALMEKFFDAGELTEEEIHKGFKVGFEKGEVYPVVCLSSKKDIGTKRLMEFITEIAPAPVADAKAPLSLFVYKTNLEQHLGDVTYFKVMSGKIGESADVINMGNDSKERITAIYAVAGKKKEKVTELVAGDLGCTVKLKSVKINQTLNAAGNDNVVAPIAFPPSKYRCAIKAVEEKDEEKLGEALNRAAAEDPTMVVEYSKELKQTILNGQGEQHINILKWRAVSTPETTSS